MKKKNLLLFAIIIASVTAKAQWTGPVNNTLSTTNDITTTGTIRLGTWAGNEGMIRFNGTDFQGFRHGQWHSLIFENAFSSWTQSGSTLSASLNLQAQGNSNFSGANASHTFASGNLDIGGQVNSTNSTKIRFVSSNTFSGTPNTPFFQLTKQYFVGNGEVFPLFTATHRGIGINTNNPLFALHVASGISYFQGPASFQDASYFLKDVKFGPNGYIALTQTLMNAPTNVKILTDGDILVRKNNVDLFKVNTSDNTTYVNKLRVTLANPFPDYVFESNYKLKPLAELGVYIQKNKHLPNVPSAEEIATNKNQIDVGEMQVKLLEKVEELTLYILQQQKEIDALKAKLAD